MRDSLSIRIVAGYSELFVAGQFVDVEARYVPNRQLLSIPFRSQLMHCAVSLLLSISELTKATRHGQERVIRRSVR
jgi:hypothetical protein